VVGSPGLNPGAADDLAAMIVVPVKAIIRIYPQMSQMFTDEEEYLCSSVNICG
jgi:hypothetical protein